MSRMPLITFRMPAELVTLGKTEAARRGVPFTALCVQGLLAELGLPRDAFARGKSPKVRKSGGANEYAVWIPVPGMAAVSVEVHADVVEMRSDGSLAFGVFVADQAQADPVQVFAAQGWLRWQFKRR